jgi:minor extracellular serine protease Vpr
MYRRLLAALAASAVLVAAVVPATAFAAPPSRQIQRAELAKIDPSFKPYLADASRQVTVVLQLSGTPALGVAGLTKTQERAHAAKLRTGQGRLDAGIRAAGGRVQGRYQYAYNGIKVRVTSKSLTKLAALPGVVAIRPLRAYTPSNTTAVPYIGAPAAWQDAGVTGAGQTIAVIDTGIDYTHATFGGPGTAAAFAANNPALIESGTFPTAKVIAGYDFAGNGYDGEGKVGSATPVPDPDPLDCNGHGSHVAGTAAGDGVKADKTTYTGPYNGTALADPADFVVGPGVAPEAKLIALKVFGCEGSTYLVVDALEWVASYNASHTDGIDVVNLSLGSPFGTNTDPEAIAINGLVDTGVVVVASAGNAGPIPYITDGPAASTKAISVAALDAAPTLPGISIQLTSGPAIQGVNMYESTALPKSGALHVVGDGAGGVGLGCAPGDFDAASAGAIVAVKRGDCVFVDKVANATATTPLRVSTRRSRGWTPRSPSRSPGPTRRHRRPSSPRRAAWSSSSPTGRRTRCTSRSPTSAPPVRAGVTAGSRPTSRLPGSASCPPSSAAGGRDRRTPARRWPPR